MADEREDTSSAFFVAPAQLSTIRQLMTPLYVGEVPIILWMLFVGAKVDRLVSPGPEARLSF